MGDADGSGDGLEDGSGLGLTSTLGLGAGSAVALDKTGGRAGACPHATRSGSMARAYDRIVEVVIRGLRPLRSQFERKKARHLVPSI